jgi:hypothetical protein
MIDAAQKHEIEMQLIEPSSDARSGEALLPTEEVPGWLAELRAHRGRVFYDDGRRPSFRRADGAFDDPDPTDSVAFHIVGRSLGRAAGCARVIPSILRDGWIDSVLGSRRVDTTLRDLGVSRSRASEGSRWVVAPEARGALGPLLVTASLALGRSLGAYVGLVLACTCRNQDGALIRMGAQPVPGVPLMRPQVADDQLRLLYFDLANLSEGLRRRVDHAAALLGIAELGMVAR